MENNEIKQNATQTKVCKKCQTAIPKKAKVCPCCRSKQGGGVGKVIVGGVCVLLLIAMVSSDTETSTENTGQTEKKTVEEYTPATIIEVLQDYEGYPFEQNEKSKKFLQENEDLFPANGIGEINNLVDEELEFKMLNKNISKYGDKFFYLDEVYVADIQEESVDNLVITTVHVLDANGNSYVIYYFDELNNIYTDDVVTVYALPVGISYFENVSGGTTIAVVSVGSIIEKLY